MQLGRRDQASAVIYTIILNEAPEIMVSAIITDEIPIAISERALKVIIDGHSWHDE